MKTFFQEIIDKLSLQILLTIYYLPNPSPPLPNKYYAFCHLAQENTKLLYRTPLLSLLMESYYTFLPLTVFKGLSFQFSVLRQPKILLWLMAKRLISFFDFYFKINLKNMQPSVNSPFVLGNRRKQVSKKLKTNPSFNMKFTLSLTHLVKIKDLKLNLS